MSEAGAGKGEPLPSGEPSRLGALLPSGEPLPSGGRARALGFLREHHDQIDSTNRRARELALAGAPHGTLVTAGEQLSGHGRQGRTWSSPPNTSLSMSLVLRDPPPLPSLAAGVAVAESVDRLLLSVTGAAGDAGAPAGTPAGHVAGAPSQSATQIKWPNDVLLAGRKVAGILVEGMPQQDWAVLGIGVNVATPAVALPPELADRAGTLGLPPSAIETALDLLLTALGEWLTASTAEIVAAVRARDALYGQPVSWDRGAEHGTGAGIDERGWLLVRRAGGSQLALDAGEVHLEH